MSKLIFKIVDKIAKKNNLSIIDIFVFYCSYAVNQEYDYDIIIKNIGLTLEKNEKEAVVNFFELLQEGDIEFISNTLIEFITDFDKASETLTLFFATFLPKDVLISKDANKIRKSLDVYPNEIRDSIIKSLEMLSAVKLLREDEKKEILKEVIKTILILTRILKVMNEA